MRLAGQIEKYLSFRDATNILVALLPVYELTLLLSWCLFPGSELFSLSRPEIAGAILATGVVLNTWLFYKRRLHVHKIRGVMMAAGLVSLQSAVEMVFNSDGAGWLWFSWAYVIAAVVALRSSAFSSWLMSGHVSIMVAAMAAFPGAQEVLKNYLLFGIEMSALTWFILLLQTQGNKRRKRKYRNKLQKLHELNYVFENLATPVVVKDEHNNIANLNQSAAELFKSTRFALIGKNLSELLPKEMAAEMQAEDRNLLAGKVFKPAIRLLHLPGLVKPRWFELKKSVFEHALNGKRGVIVSVEDVHERVLFEQKMKEAERKFRSIFEHAPVGMMMIKKCLSNFVEVNKALCNSLGFSKKELLRISPADLMHPDEVQANSELILRAWEEKREHLTLDKRLLTKNREVIHSICALQFIYDHGSPSYIIAMMLDISERKEYEERLRRQSHLLEQSNRSLKEFAYAVSHDLREPLRTISSFTQLMLRSLPKETLPPKVEEFAGYIQQGVARMDLLITQLLEYSREGNSQLQIQETDPVEVIARVCYKLGMQFQENGASVEVSCPLPVLKVDPVKFESLLQNLISNAIKYRKPEVSPVIALNLEERKDDWMVAVMDNGKGIAEGDLEKVFQLFYRTGSANNIPGTGIGLSLCQKIVNKHGGQIWADSKEGEGTTFFFTISRNQYHLRSGAMA